MNQSELQERNITTAKIGKRTSAAVTKTSTFGELHHPEMLFFGIDGGVDSYIFQEAKAGNLPNFARLLKKSTRLTELRTAHPSITPCCWTSITTGATPEIHGIVSDRFHKGGKLSDKLNCYDGNHLTAERFWEAAARIGKTSLVAGVPVTAPARSNLVRQCGGYCGYRGTRADSALEYFDVPMQLWFFDLDKKPCGMLENFSQSPSPSELLPNGNIRLDMFLDQRPGANYRNIKPFSWELRADEDGFTLLCENEEIKLLPESWGKPFFRELAYEKGSLRMPFIFGCYQFPDGYLVISDVTGDMSDVCTPEMYEITRELPPPPLDKAWIFWNNPATARIALDSCDNQIDWHIELMRRALSKEASDIVVNYFPFTDTVNHFFWQTFSGCISSTPEITEMAKDAYREIYAIADRYLGFLLDEVADENTTILVVSDHGSLGHVADNNVNDVLAKAGLLVYDADGAIDCTRSRAASGGCGHIWVNLQGRETGGIVTPEKYEDTVYEIINALQENFHGPDGRSYLAFAVRKEEAGFFGIGGENCGDVVFGLTAGYAAMTIHAEQITSARSKYGNMLSLGLISGPGVAGDQTVSTPCRTIDLAPTICDLLGYPHPKNCCGGSIRQLIEK